MTEDRKKWEIARCDTPGCKHWAHALEKKDDACHICGFKEGHYVCSQAPVITALSAAEAALRRIATMAGNPDAVEACRLICEEVKKVLE